MFIDGGLRIFRLNVETGELIGEKVHDDRDPTTGENMQKHVRGLNMPVALPDILSSDGERLFMRSQAMDLEGKRLKLGPGGSGFAHLFAPYGFTDDSWFHRNYWLVNDAFSGGIGGYGNGKKSPSGRILVDDGATVFGYGRKPSYYRWSSVIDYQLFAAARSAKSHAAAKPAARPKPAAKRTDVSAIHFENSKGLNPTGKALTIAAWVKSDTKDGTILVRGAGSMGFALILTDSKPRMLLRANKKTYSIAALKPVDKDWTHVAGVLTKGGKMHVYVGGVLSGTVEDIPLLTADPMINMKVGSDDTHQLLPKPLTPFSGAMDEVMLFHRALSSEQIKRLAAGGSKLAAADRESMVLYLDFKGGKARDRSGGKNNGQLDSATPQTVEGPFSEAMVFKGGKAGATRVAAARRRGKGRRGGSGVKFLWTRDLPIMVRAMVLADRTLFIAGPADLLDEDAAFQKFADSTTQKKLTAQADALAGKSGAVLQAVDAETGKTLAEYTLDSPPVLDGLIATDGRLFLTTMDGRLIAFGE